MRLPTPSNLTPVVYEPPSALVRSAPAQSLPPDIARQAAAVLFRMGMEPDGSGGIRAANMRDVKNLNEKMFRAYDAAITDNYNAGFRSTYGSSDSEILSSLYTVVARCRTICKDTVHGKNILRVYANNVVGHRGFRLKMRLGKKTSVGGKSKFIPEEDLNDEIEDLYEIAGRPENFTVRKDCSRVAAFKIMVESAVRDGKILLKHHNGFLYNDFGYAVELLEGDRLQESYMGRAPNTGNPIRFSCELHPIYHFKVAYWLLTRHPGDPFGSYPSESSNVWRERVDADDIILYNNMADRAEQTIGFPELDSVIQHMFRDAQYEKALALAAIASCCKPYWVEKLFPTGMQFDSETFNNYIKTVSAQMAEGPGGVVGDGPSSGTVARQEGIGARSSTEVPAGTREMEWGQALRQLDPKFPIEAATQFKRDNLHAVGAGAGMSFQKVSGYFDNLGFSASRLCQLPEQDNFRMWQENFIDMVVRPEFKMRMRAAIMSGKLAIPMARLDEIVNAASWTGVRWPFTNPIQDAQAMILLLEANLISPQQAQDSLPYGMSLDDLYSEIEQAQEAAELHNVQTTEDMQVTKPTVKQGEVGAELPEPSTAAQAPSVTKLANPVRRRGISETTMRLMEMQGDGGASLNGARH